MGLTTQVYSACPWGVEARLITVEIYARNVGIPSFALVGLPDPSIREAKERMMAAIRTSGMQFPSVKITVNLAPADIKKEGAEFDLPMALGILAQCGCLPPGAFERAAARYLFLGELGLDGSVRPVRGALAASCLAREKGFCGVVVPEANRQEAALVEGVEVIGVKSLSHAFHWLSGACEIIPFQHQDLPRIQADAMSAETVDLADIEGNALAKKALEVSAAGGHNLLLVGPPGVGKTLLARALPGILPPLSLDEMLEVAKIYSLNGTGSAASGVWISERPFRSVHHSVTSAALTGGGSRALPGEVTLAHRGVLFLDEMAEFSRQALDSLRQPLEDGEVVVARAGVRHRYPARFMLIGAANPCPCGWWGTKEKECLCLPSQILRYRRRLSGPLLDRMDLHVAMQACEFRRAAAGGSTSAATSETVRRRVIEARKLQERRFKKAGKLNAHMNLKEIKAYCKMPESAQQFLGDVMNKYGLSARAYHRILKAARTLADLDGAAQITHEHVAMAVQMRILDRLTNV